MRRLASLVAAIAVLAGICASTVVAQSKPIRPHQRFYGLVDGSSGSAVIRMACFGAIQPGQTGHPFGGQTVAVTRSATGSGFTGEASSIRARLFWSTSTTTSSVALALFHSYDEPAAISTAPSFPCQGTGRVVFRPVSGGTDARPAVVKVYFEGQP
jgi:hypothetical protein